MVIWTVAARRLLRQALAETTCRRNPNAATDAMSDLDQSLGRIFPDARAVIVQHLYTGFRRRDDEFILLVEVDGADRPGRHVVKLASESRLKAELAAWDSCRPHGLRHDLVFMTLEPCLRDGSLIGLIYGDAQQFIGLPSATSLEAAFLDAVRHDSPSAASVGLVLGQLFERAGHLLYPRCFVEDPAYVDFALGLPRLRKGLEGWERSGTSAARARQDCHTSAASGRGEFRDPVDYLRYVEPFAPWEPAPPVPGEPARTARVRQPVDIAGGPAPERWLPRLLRGCSHGDLHGRNVLVGVVHGRALWPAVFDYEHMGPGNLLGLDFVKLETELKERAYPELFPVRTTAEFVRKVQAFEIELAAATEECHQRGGGWPETVGGSGPADRLRWLLLVLRQQASLHLGMDRGRPRDWLDEYYFLLACYGIGVVRFDNLQQRERVAAYVSAGVATARFLWNREPRG